MKTHTGLGRPSKITRQDIVDAALEIGLDRVTVRNVADALRMSVPGLYHYVRSREELVDLVVEASFARLADSAVEATTFKDCLLYAARALFELVSRHPALVIALSAGTSVITPMVATRLEHLISMGVQSGLEPIQCYEIYTRLISCVVGAAVVDAGDRAMRSANTPFLTKIGHALADDEEGRPELRRLADEAKSRPMFDHFGTVLTMLEALLVTFEA